MAVKRTMMAYRRNTHSGFTIIEVMIAMVISSALIAAVYQTFHSQQRSYTMQSQAAEMEQNLRGALYLLTRELRSAGYNPKLATADPSVSTKNFRFVKFFPTLNNPPSVDYATNHFMVAFTLDTDTCQRKNPPAPCDPINPKKVEFYDGTIESGWNEQIAYKFDNVTKPGTLQRFNDVTQKWETVASNIEAVYFTYYDQNKTITPDPTSIQYVEISLLARMAKQDSKYKDETVYTTKDGVKLCPLVMPPCPTGYFGDHYHRRLLTTTIQIRNKLITPS